MDTFIYEIIHGLVLMLAGVFIWKRATRPKYRWKCPVRGCEFAVSSTTDPMIVNTIADRHQEGHAYG